MGNVRDKSNADPRTDIVIMGAANEVEAREVGKEVDAYMKGVMDEAKMNDTERRVFTAMYSFRRTLGVIEEEGDLPEEIRNVLMSLMVQVAREIPKELCDRDKITKSVLKVAPEIEKIIERVHKKHCDKCREGGEHAHEPPADAAAALNKHWN